jgi:hypothetical protein
VDKFERALIELRITRGDPADNIAAIDSREREVLRIAEILFAHRSDLGIQGCVAITNDILLHYRPTIEWKDEEPFPDPTAEDPQDRFLPPRRVSATTWIGNKMFKAQLKVTRGKPLPPREAEFLKANMRRKLGDGIVAWIDGRDDKS